MNKKLILTSILAIGVAGAANATPTAAVYPDSEATTPATMWTDKSYAGAAVNDNTGIYEGEVEAWPVFEWDSITLAAGTYLPQGYLTNGGVSGTGTGPQTCEAGSYCPGASNIHYDNTQDQGITACDAGFPNSDAGSDAAADCYRDCLAVNAGTSFTALDHATSYTGRDQYGADMSIDTCGAADCADGWHVQAPVGSMKDTLMAATVSSSSSEGKVWIVNYNGGDKLTGYGRCSRRAGTENEKVVALVDRTGEEDASYCYCNVDTYTTGGADLAVKGNWLYQGDMSDGATCESSCAATCKTLVAEGSTFAGEILSNGMGYNTTSLAKCTANPIAIDWKGTTDAWILTNNAESTIYGGDVRTPVNANKRTGQTFKGWKFGTYSQDPQPANEQVGTPAVVQQ